MPGALLLAALSLLPQEVLASTRFEPATAPAGSVAELRVRLDIQPGWHVYHPAQDPGAPGAPVSVQVEGEGFKAVGPLRCLQEPRVKEEDLGGQLVRLLELPGTPEFVLPVWVEGLPGRAAATVKVGFSACDASRCLPPQTLNLSAELDRLPSAPGAAMPGGFGTRGEVQWSASIEPLEPKSGEQALLRLRAEVEPGWHLYHPLMSPDLGVPVQVTSVKGAMRPIPATLLSTRGAVELHEENLIPGKTSFLLWLGGNVEFTLPVLVDGEPGVSNAELGVRWQTCTESLCNPSQLTTLSLPVTIRHGGARLPEPAPVAVSPESPPESPAPPSPEPEPADGAGSPAAAPPASERSAAELALGQGFLAFLAAAVLAALFSLATPCVFPMIPITVSFFTKRSEAGKGQPLPNALAYGAGIVLTFVGLGLGITALYGAGGINSLASNPFLNLALAALFVVFALSLLGLYDINPPRWLQARLSAATARGQARAGYGPVMLMAVAFSVTAFTCTVAFVGGLLALAANGAWFYAFAGMTVYALVFAAPFVVLALFPSALAKLPRAGGWMEDVKVAMGFLELIFALKFFSNADFVWDLQILTRPVVIALTAIPIVMWASCLFRVFRTPHQFEHEKPGPGRVALGALALAAGAYVLNGLRGATYHGPLEGYFPPPSYGVTLPAGAGDDPVHVGESVKLGPANLRWFESYPEAFQRAADLRKPLFLDFTGVTCINCRRMENNIFPHDQVRPLLQQYVRAELWVDKPPYGDWNKQYQIERFHSPQQPQYVILDPRTDRVVEMVDGYRPDAAGFAAFLQRGLDALR